MEKYDLIIVGAGPAGIFTAVELLRHGSKKKMLLVEKGKPVEKRHCPKAEVGHCVNSSTGPVIGHCSPEAQTGGPIALVEEGDLIEIDIPARKLNIIGIKGERKSPEEIDAVLAQRRAAWKPKPRRYKRGTLRLFSEHAASPMKGAYLEYND